MNPARQKRALAVAVQAARAAGQLMQRNASARKKINEEAPHDIKLELDVRCQKLIEARLLAAFPASSVWGEEGLAGDPDADVRWVVDPIDGTVNFTYGIPHACVSIACQHRPAGADDFETCAGVVYDPFADELWSAVRGGPARLNGRIIRVSDRRTLGETIVSIGFGKDATVVNAMLPVFGRLIHRVRKVRIMGAAALALTYVASGRFDAYIEPRLRFWDIAAGGLILECAGGEFWRRPVPGEETFEVIATNGRLRRQIQRHV